MHGENASVDITSENIQNELRKIKELLEPYDPVVGLLCNLDGAYKGQPIVIAQDKSHKCFRARANLLCMTAIGKKHEIEYHYSTNAWMTTYVKKLNVAFGRQNQEIALLLDNASIHKIRVPLNNIKLIFLLENTTSKLQTHDAGSVDNFKAHFRAQRYDRTLCLYISKKLDNPNVYKMDQAQAMFSLANEWLKVKPETTKGMLPDLPRNFDNKVTDVSQLNLEADESEMIVCYTTSTTNNEETAEGNIDKAEENDNTEQGEQRVDIVEFLLDDLDRKLHRRIRMRLADSCAELNKSKEQTDLGSYFTNLCSFHLVCRIVPEFVQNHERTHFVENIVPSLLALAKITGFIEFKWCEAPFLSSKRLNLKGYDYDYRSASSNKLGILKTQNNMELIIAEVSRHGTMKENTTYTIEDALKILECSVSALRKEVTYYKNASLKTFKKLKIYSLQVIKTQVTLSEMSLSNKTHWKFIEKRVAKLPTNWNDQLCFVQYLELLATLFDSILTTQQIQKQSVKENLGLVEFSGPSVESIIQESHVI
ncbi:hypothetical protein G6F43_011734 [Rhizopus delemar]|nr:hypothetical protein G6F43_011734 [Rhizopus delemar]